MSFSQTKRFGALSIATIAVSFAAVGCGSSSSSSSQSASGGSGATTTAAAAAATSSTAAATTSAAAGGAAGSALANPGSANGAGLAEFFYNPSPYGIASQKAAEQLGAKLGFKVTTFDGNNVSETQSTQMQDAITSGKYKAFWVWALDGTSLAPVIKQAEAKGIKVAVADYTLGDLASQVHLSPTPGLVSTVGYSVGAEDQAFVSLIKGACAKQVGAGKPCTVAFMPGLANYPNDTLRLNYMKAHFANTNIKFTLTPPGMYDQPTAQKVALTYFQAKPSVQVFASFGDQMSAGALTAFSQLGITPGKDIQVIGSGATNQFVSDIKAGTVFGSVALYPTTETDLGLKALAASLNGKKVPTTIDVIDKNHPFAVDQQSLKTATGFHADWSLTGATN